MMNHPSGMPYGQMPPRRNDMPYPPMPPNMRPQAGYQAYYHPQMGPPMPPYAPHYQQQWYQYPQHIPHYPPQQPPRQYQHYPPSQHQQYHAPPAVSSQLQPPMPNAPAHVPPAQTQQQSSAPMPAPSPAPNKDPSSPAPHSTSSSANLLQETPPSTASTGSDFAPQSGAVTPGLREPFHPPVPWLSVMDQGFPSRAPRRKRKIVRSSLAADPVTFPLEPQFIEKLDLEGRTGQPEDVHTKDETHTDNTAASDPMELPTPQTSDALSDTTSTQPTTPSSAAPPASAKTPTQSKSRVAVPILPAVPLLPTSPTTSKRPHRDSIVSIASKVSESQEPAVDGQGRKASAASMHPAETSNSAEPTTQVVSPPAAPKTWADMFRGAKPAAKVTNIAGAVQSNGLTVPRSESLSDVLQAISSNVGQPASRIAFLKPRGLVNNSNTCYMNSVLQILILCVPFYDMLDRVAQKAVHRFKSDTPVIDAMIMFLGEFPVIDSAESAEKLRLRLKPEDYENFGAAFTPEYVYSAIRDLPRFRDMHRGHQQDAQEFLGFLLEELHEECIRAMKSGSSTSSVTSGSSTPLGSTSNVSEAADAEAGWMEVGHKQKPSVTRNAGATHSPSPMTKIFGGQLRSELKVAGSMNSVTQEPFQPLQLDIGAPNINNIIDALRGLSKPESMSGAFPSPRGQKTTATKQVYIETLPPVLILHLKRFQYDNVTRRTEKIYKKIGYPLDLEIPKEAFPISQRNRLSAQGGLPRYKLTGVIYHHGKNASMGHYTVDLRRQDGREWIRLDDTIIRRVRSEEVAEAGGEEDPKVLAAALEKHKQQKKSGGNMFEQIERDEEAEEETENSWSQVNGHSRSKSAMSTVINGTSTPMVNGSGQQTPSQKSSIKDNKVAYLLFYQRI